MFEYLSNVSRVFFRSNCFWWILNGMYSYWSISIFGWKPAFNAKNLEMWKIMIKLLVLYEVWTNKEMLSDIVIYAKFCNKIW